MTWTRLGDTFTDRPITLGVSRSARLLNVEGLVWCNRHTSNGKLPVGALPRLTDSPNPAADVAELVAAGVWQPTDFGWQLDWSEQEMAEDVRDRQAARNEKQRRYRRRKSKHDAGDHSLCDARYCKARVDRNGSGNADRNEQGDVTHSLPVPSRPEGTGTGSTGPEAQAPRPVLHQWQDDGSGQSCGLCGLPQGHLRHSALASAAGAAS